MRLSIWTCLQGLMKIQQWLFNILRKQNVTDGLTHGRTDNVKTVYPPQTKFAEGGGGGIITQPAERHSQANKVSQDQTAQCLWCLPFYLCHILDPPNGILKINLVRSLNIIGPVKQFFLNKIAIIFLPINLNMCFDGSKEPSHWDGSFEYPQHMFWMRNKEIVFHYTLLSGGMA